MIRSLKTYIPAICMLLALQSFTPVTTGSHLPAANISSAIQVKFLGGDNQSLYFSVKYENRSGDTFNLQVLDEMTGDALFQDKFSQKDFNRKFRIPRMTDTDGVIFLIRSVKENVQLSYKVKVTAKVVDKQFS